MIGLDAQIACVKRELQYREFVYPRRVAEGAMSQATMRREIERMKAVLATLEELEAKGRLL